MNTIRFRAMLPLAGLVAAAALHAAPADLTAADRSFLADAAKGNQMEIDLGKLAQQQASSRDVKSFAATMVRDHTRLGATMKAKFGDAVDAASSPTPPELTGKSGHDFDKAYMDLMVSDHEKDIAKFEQAASGADHGASVHKAAKDALPTLRRHGAMAKTVDGKL